jgi:sortase (surface protein transpeptidase)
MIRSARWALLSVGLLVIAIVCFTQVIKDQQNQPAAIHRQILARAEISAPAKESVTPIALRIPAIGVSKQLVPLGLNPDKTVQVPADYDLPGWFRLGPAPGKRGSSVILGHVDSYTGPAVFFGLHSLQIGDTVDVDLSDGTVAQFAVNEVAVYPKVGFPAERVYGSHGKSALNLVTCGGKFDDTIRSYESNVVVYTTLVGTPKRN